MEICLRLPLSFPKLFFLNLHLKLTIILLFFQGNSLPHFLLPLTSNFLHQLYSIVHWEPNFQPMKFLNENKGSILFNLHFYESNYRDLIPLRGKRKLYFCCFYHVLMRSQSLWVLVAHIWAELILFPLIFE